MAKISGKYEIVYIIDPAQGEEGIAALVEKFKAMVEAEGTLTGIEEWGKRRLAYPINDLPEGYYVLVHYTAETSVPKEIERNMGITDNILRYLTTRIEHKTTGVKPRTARIAPSAPEASAPEAAAEVSEQAEESAPEAE